MERKQLKPDEYSQIRKDAMIEVYGTWEKFLEAYSKYGDRHIEVLDRKNKQTNEVDYMVNPKTGKKKNDGGVSSMKIPCSKCGKEKMAGQPRLGNLIKKFGSVEKLMKGYICKDCRGKEKPKNKEEKKGK